MIQRGLKLTSIRRHVLASLTPDRGEPPDELRRKVAQRLGLYPSSPRWNSFSTVLTRTLRIMEEKGTLSVRREDVLFGKPCMSWVSLTDRGALERSRVVQGEGELPFLGPETPLTEKLTAELACASLAELDALAALVAHERARRAGG
jgi:hypothetical protein